MYKVKAIINFDDVKANVRRNAGDIFEVSKERFEYLSGNNPKKLKAVELIEIKKWAVTEEKDGIHVRPTINDEIIDTPIEKIEVPTIKNVDKALKRVHESAKEEVKRKPRKKKN